MGLNVARKRPMPPALKAYWARKRAGKSARTSRRKPVKMASRRFARARGFARRARGSRGRSSTRGDLASNLIDGALVGIGNRFISGYVGPTWGRPLTLYAVGHFRGNSTLTTLAGLGVGESLAAGISLPGMASSSTTGVL